MKIVTVDNFNDENLATFEIPLNEIETEKDELTGELTSSSKERGFLEEIKAKLEQTLQRRADKSSSGKEKMNSMDAITTNGSACLGCVGRDADVKRLQQEVESLKREIERITFESTELSTSLEDMEAVIYEKDEAIKSLELSLSIEQEARSSLDADLREKTSECLTLIESLEKMSSGSKEKQESHKLFVEKLHLQLDEKDKEIEKNRQEIAKLSGARTAAEEINASLQETATSLSEQLKNIGAEKDEILDAKNRVEQEMSELKKKLDDISQQLEESMNNICAASASNEEISQLKDDAEKLRRKIHEMESDHQRKVADLTAMQESQSQFVEILTKKVEDSKREKMDWGAERASLLSEIKTLKEEKSTVSEEAEHQTLMSQAQIDELTYQIADLTNVKEDQCQLIDSLTKNLEQLESEKSDWIKERDRITSQIEELKHGKESAENQQHSSEETVTNLTNEIEERKAAMENQIQMIDMLSKQLEQIQDEKSAWAADRERLTSQIEQLKEEKKSVEITVDKLQQTTDVRTVELEKQLNSLKEQKENADRVIETLFTEVEQLQEERRAWMEEKASTTSRIEQMEEAATSRNRAIEEERRDHNERVDELTKRNSDLSEELKEACDSIVALQSKISSLETAMNNLKQSHVDELKRIKAQREEENERRTANTEQQYDQIRNDFEEAMRKVQQLTEEKAVADSEMVRLREVLAEKQNELVSLRIKDANANAFYDDAKRKIEILEKELQRKKSTTELIPSLRKELKKAAIIESDEEADYVPNVSTPSSSPRSPNSSENEHWHCDNCNTVTDHSTENCPHVVRVKENQQENRLTNSDEYCEFCSEYGHDTFACQSYKLRHKEQFHISGS
ncbi:hypothetical protein RB195_012379 [Necator americanus]|uniref:CLIP1 zinc knuckle domain-containing protein n=1 Tax=Necator americanus TaxID=51031 RepID=A0ABR1D7M0_NECAM